MERLFLSLFVWGGGGGLFLFAMFLKNKYLKKRENGPKFGGAKMSFTGDARTVFEYWKASTRHPRSHLDAKREKVITARLHDGYSVDDLRLAALGCATSRFHQGENDNRQIYDSVELIYRNADQVDKFMRLGEEELERRAAKKRAEEERRKEATQPATRGPVYQEAKARLLSIVKKTERAA